MADAISPAATNEDGTPVKRGRGRPPGSTNKPKATNIQSEVEGLLAFTNLVVANTPYRDDALTPDEQRELAAALVEEINANPKVLRWMNRAGKVLPHIRLMNVVGMIAYVRLVKHGKINIAAASSPTAFPMDAGGAHGVDWGHRDGQVNAYGEAFSTPIVPNHSSDQAG